MPIITKYEPTSWKDLQNNVGQILRNCGFEVEVEKTINSVRGSVEIDVYAEEIVDTQAPKKPIRPDQNGSHN
jgi:restriction system protein